MAELLTVRLEVHIPQLTTIGAKIVASLNTISEALDSLSATLDQELTEIADALSGSPAQADIDAVAQRVIDLRDKISNIIP